MSFSDSAGCLEEDLLKFFTSHEEDCFLLHTDILNWGPICQEGSRTERLEKYYSLLNAASVDKTLFFPVFNYDYGKTRIFDVLEDKCQVGVLNEFVRLRNRERRTRTPIFNFLEIPHDTFPKAPSSNPFGPGSLWDDLCRREGRICFMGVVSETNTFTHFIEDEKQIGYRYYKRMPGIVRFNGVDEYVDFTFRVRPRVSELVQYDWQGLNNALERDGLLVREPLGKGVILSYNAKKARDYLLEKLDDDEFFFLTEESRRKLSELRKSKPYPFRFEDFEQEAEK